LGFWRHCFSIMEFSELVQIVKDAICICEAKIQENSNMVLSEADLERHLSNVISSLLEQIRDNEFVVHNQISHYPSYKPKKHDKRDYQVDVLMMKDKDIQKDEFRHKGFYYFDDSIALELKYIRGKDSVNKIEEDLIKHKSLLKTTKNRSFFVVALLEDNSKRKDAENVIYQYRKKHRVSKLNFFTHVITKEPLNNE